LFNKCLGISLLVAEELSFMKLVGWLDGWMDGWLVGKGGGGICTEE